VDLSRRLRELAGDAAYAAGRDYLKKGLVRHGTVAGTTAHATVTGSTDYRISVAFASDLPAPKVTCTCPAHRRNKHCKHVVAVVVGLLERPGEFTPVEPAPLPAEATTKGTAKRRGGTKGGSGGTAKERTAAQRAEQQATGLAVVDRLLEELAAGGLASLGTEGTALLAEAAETVRALKLRRLGNRLMALQRLASVHGASASRPMPTVQTVALVRQFAPIYRPSKGRTGELADGGEQNDEARFAAILCDVALARRTLGAQAEGRVTLEPALAEDLLGKTWRDADLERVAGLELFPLGEERLDDGEFKVETSYLLDPRDGAVYAEKQISPLALRSSPKPTPRQRLLVDEAGLYPGDSPRRIKLLRTRRLPLTTLDVERVLDKAATDVATLRARLVDRLRSPFGPAEAAVLFRPAELLRDGAHFGALDATGRFLSLTIPSRLAKDLPSLLPESGRYLLFGSLRPAETPAGMALACISAVGDLLWGNGPVCPDDPA
jgi:hypothetical protein